MKDNNGTYIIYHKTTWNQEWWKENRMACVCGTDWDGQCSTCPGRFQAAAGNPLPKQAGPTASGDNIEASKKRAADRGWPRGPRGQRRPWYSGHLESLQSAELEIQRSFEMLKHPTCGLTYQVLTRTHGSNVACSNGWGADKLGHASSCRVVCGETFQKLNVPRHCSLGISNHDIKFNCTERKRWKDSVLDCACAHRWRIRSPTSLSGKDYIMLFIYMLSVPASLRATPNATSGNIQKSQVARSLLGNTENSTLGNTENIILIISLLDSAI